MRWLSVILTAIAVLAALPELIAYVRQRSDSRRPASPRTRAVALITFLVLIIIGLLMVSLSNYRHGSTTCTTST